MTRSIPGNVQIGHWTDADARTGCTVVLFDQLTPTIVDIRGAAPGTRETDLLGPDKSVGAVDAILLTGGSAHGLAAADGVMDVLRDRGRGVPTRAGAVPIVTAAVIYDLAIGQPVWPTADAGRAAAASVVPIDAAAMGTVGVGTGATYRKAWPTLEPRSGGIALAAQEIEGVGTAWALVVLNAIGDTEDNRSLLLADPSHRDERANTTLMSILLDGSIDAKTLRRCAIAAHDGLARQIKPAHTQFDGDAAFVSALQPLSDIDAAQSFQWAVAIELAVESAIREITNSSASLDG